MRNVLVLLSLFLGCMACSSSQDAYVVVENSPGGDCFVEVLSATSESRYENSSDAQDRAVFTLPGASVDSLYVISVSDKRRIFSATPGDTIYLVFEKDERGMNSRVKFKNPDAYNQYLERWNERMELAVPGTEFCFSKKKTDNIMRFMQPVEEVFSKDNLQKVLALENECLQELKDAHVQDQQFLDVQKRRIRQVCWYLNTTILKVTAANVGMKLPIDVRELLNKVDLNDRSLLDFWPLSTLLNDYFLGMRQFVESEGAFDEYLSLEAEKIGQDEIREFFVLDQLSTLMREGHWERLDAIAGACEKHVKSEAGKKKYQELCSGILQQIKAHPFNGKPTMDFAFEDQHGRTVKLDDFKGKYLLIDVWATWCGPCKKEIPCMHALEEEFAERNIAFASLSIDEENAKNLWLKMVANSGIALFGSNGYDTPFVRHYNIEYIPHFLLIGPDGTMISSKARKPSDTLLRKLLVQLLDV